MSGFGWCAGQPVRRAGLRGLRVGRAGLGGLDVGCRILIYT